MAQWQYSKGPHDPGNGCHAWLLPDAERLFNLMARYHRERVASGAQHCEHCAHPNS